MRRPVFIDEINRLSEKLLGVRPGMAAGDRAYRGFVLPLGCFSALGGLISVPLGAWGVLSGQTIGSGSMPAWLVLVIGLLLSAMGVGLIRRSRAAWYAFLAYWLIGTPIVAAVRFHLDQAMQVEYPDVGGRAVYAVFALMMEIAGVVILIKGRAAFATPSAEPQATIEA